MSLLTGHSRLGWAAVCLDAANHTETIGLFIGQIQPTGRNDSLHWGSEANEGSVLSLDLSELCMKAATVMTALAKLNH